MNTPKKLFWTLTYSLKVGGEDRIRKWMWPLPSCDLYNHQVAIVIDRSMNRSSRGFDVIDRWSTLGLDKWTAQRLANVESWWIEVESDKVEIRGDKHESCADWPTTMSRQVISKWNGKVEDIWQALLQDAPISNHCFFTTDRRPTSS